MTLKVDTISSISNTVGAQRPFRQYVLGKWATKTFLFSELL